MVIYQALIRRSQTLKSESPSISWVGSEALKQMATLGGGAFGRSVPRSHSSARATRIRRGYFGRHVPSERRLMETFQMISEISLRT